MSSVLYLIVAVLGFILVFSALVGAVRFWKDLNRFKSELQFSGSRKELINFLIDRDKEGDNDVSE